jgi:RND family efflux transporter MFP subunit
MSKRIVIMLLAIVAIVGYLVWKTHPVLANHAAAKVDANASTLPPRSTAVRTEGRLATYPGAQVNVSSERAGILDVLAVQENQKVAKGQLIGHLRSHDLEAQIAQEKARLAEIKADIRLYELEAQRYKKLFEAKVGTEQAEQKAERDLELAQARLGTEEATIAELQTQLDKTYIHSPISGVVLKRNKQQGENVDIGESIVTIADLNRVRIEAEVDEFDLANVKLNEQVVIHAEGFDRTWKAHVEEIPGQVEGRKLKPEDPGRPVDTRVLLVKIAFDEPTPLKLGQRVEVDLK